MRDNATVITVRDDLAWVKVASCVPCADCSANAFCAGQRDAEGRLAVRNPVQAKPGDEVEIEVPEERYHRDLIVIFGILLAASLAGLALGYGLSPVRGLSSEENALLGLLLGLFLSGFGLLRAYRGRMKKSGYPVIVGILRKGEFHG
jgi:positive regulator of sigma E activity